MMSFSSFIFWIWLSLYDIYFVNCLYLSIVYLLKFWISLSVVFRVLITKSKLYWCLFSTSVDTFFSSSKRMYTLQNRIINYSFFPMSSVKAFLTPCEYTYSVWYSLSISSADTCMFMRLFLSI